MLPDPVLTKAALSIATLALKNTTVQARVRKAVGRDPLQRAVADALAAAVAELETRYPDQVAALFDASFLEREAAPVFAAVLTRGAEASPTELARRYVASLGPNRTAARSVRATEPVAAAALAAYTASIRRHDFLAPLLDSKALDAMADSLAAVAAALDAGRPTGATLWDYLDWVIDRNLYLDARGTMQTQRQVQLRLDEVFVSLDAELLDGAPDKAAEKERPGPGHPAPVHPAPGRPAPGNPAPVHPAQVRTARSLADVVGDHPAVVVLGDPGAGKTTLLRHLALTAAQALAATGVPGSAALPVPMLLRISAYAEGDAWRTTSLTEFLGSYHRAADCPASGVGPLLEATLDEGRGLVLLDGLDEVVALDARIGVVQRIEDFLRRHGRRGNRVVVTSRVAGYREAGLGGVAHFRAAEMTRDQVELFLDRWCTAVEDTETPDLSADERRAVAAREVAGILTAYDTTPGVARLAVNPLMLRILALIHRTGATLPQQRVALYKIAADTLARTWRLAQGVPESALAKEEHVTRLLSALAYWMHTNRPSGVATWPDVLEVLGPEWARIVGRDWDPDDPPVEVVADVRGFLDTVRIQTGLFVERSPERYGFLHLTFEEYYAARALIARPRARVAVIRRHLHDPRWEEPILLALAFVGLDYPEDAAELVEETVVGDSAWEEWLGRDFLFLLRCLGDGIPVSARTARAHLELGAREYLTWTGRGRINGYREALKDRLFAITRTAHRPVLVAALERASADLPDRPPPWATRVTWVATGNNRELAKVAMAVPAVRRWRLAETRSEDAVLRADGALELAAVLPDPDVLDRLLELSRDSVSDVRAATVAALANAGEVPTVHRTLVQLADDPAIDVWPTALGTLAEAQAGEIAPYLAGLATAGGEPVIRDVAAELLAGLASSPGAAGLLVAAGTDPTVRAHAARALVHFPVDEVLPHQLAFARDADPAVRAAVAYALSPLARRSAPGVLPCLTALGADPDPVVRASAAGSLAEATDPATTALLLDLTADTDSTVRVRAASALMSRATDPAVQARLLNLAADPYTPLRAAATGALGPAVADGTVRTRLLDASRDTDAEVRGDAAEALAGAVVDLEVAGRLLALASDDEDAMVRSTAARLLAESPSVGTLLLLLGSVAETAPLLDGLAAFVRSKAHYRLRVLAVPLLAALHGDGVDAVPALVEGLLDDDDDVRTECERSLALLGRLGVPTVGPRLAATFTDARFDRLDKIQEMPAEDWAYEALSALSAPGARPEESVSWLRAREAHAQFRVQRPELYPAPDPT